MITDRNVRHEVFLPINHKNYNFREKKNSQIMKEMENLHLRTDKGGINVPLNLNFECHWADLNYNFECDWLLNCLITNCPITT